MIKKFKCSPVLGGTNLKHRSVMAAEEDEFDAPNFDDTEDDFNDAEFEDEEVVEEDVDPDTLIDSINNIQKAIEDVREQIEDVEQDDIDIAMNNNITDHYIAECDRCKGVFISAVSATDTPVESVTGQCPLCKKETTQYLNWIIKEA